MNLLNIEGDVLFHKTHKVFWVKEGEMEEVYITKIDDNFINVESKTKDFKIHQDYIYKMDYMDKSRMFDFLIKLQDNNDCYVISDILQVYPITTEKIFLETCTYYGVFKETIMLKTRKREIVKVRQMAMKLSVELTKDSLATIGECIGGKDHSTVLYAKRTIDGLIDVDKKVKKDYDTLFDILTTKYKVNKGFQKKIK
jgi:Zn-dependent peptidase ImmA (M78 family)